MSIVIFSKYLNRMVGGAEKSVSEIVKMEPGDVDLIAFDSVKAPFTKYVKKNKALEQERWSLISPKAVFSRFVYIEYLLNRNLVKKYFNNLTGDAELYTYGMYAPIAVLAYKGNSRLFIRSETDLAINANYYSGIKWFVKLVYILLEYPAFLVYKHDVNMAIKKSDVVCNSKFILKKTYDLFSKKGKLQYPFIDIDRLKAELKKVNLSQTRKGVVFIGDSYLKGLNIALKISKLMPDIEFYFFSRHISTESIVGNITWLPWRDNEAEVYGFAKLVIVPSIWEEAYGRVSREAFLLNIPVLVSNRGGLPETVDGKQNYIVEDYLNPEIWKEKIENFL